MTSSTLPNRTTTRRPYETARRLRERASLVGIDPVIAASTPHEDIEAVIHAAPFLRAVDDIDLEQIDWSDGADERVSTLHYIASVRGEDPDAPVLDAFGMDPWGGFVA